MQIKNKTKNNTINYNIQNNNKEDNIYMVVSYTRGFSESSKNIGKKKYTSTLQRRQYQEEPLGCPKEKDTMTQKSGMIYRYKCDRVECDAEYMLLGLQEHLDRLKEHLKSTSPIHDHSNITGHHTSIDNYSTMEREPHY